MTQTAPIITIVEVIGPALQGTSLPLLCTGADGQRYYVKGQQTNRSSLWCEWICAHLAQALGLPLPPFSLVQLDEALVRELPKDWQAIGSLPAFGSREQPHTVWLELGIDHKVAPDLQRKVLAFDWWVRNTDRLRGNTNLLWDTAHQSLIVIDHNLAFSNDFNAAEFIDQHVFADQWPALAYDLVAQAQHAQWLHGALDAAAKALHLAPKEWLWENSEFDVPAKFDRTQALRLLERCATPDFWRAV
ncbi:MAG TPA: hypothetical protein PLL92_10370 [Alicycliphilus sp.]|nr:hypothetical protein [Alicycliphilus sp.]